MFQPLTVTNRQKILISQGKELINVSSDYMMCILYIPLTLLTHDINVYLYLTVIKANWNLKDLLDVLFYYRQLWTRNSADSTWKPPKKVFLVSGKFQIRSYLSLRIFLIPNSIEVARYKCWTVANCMFHTPHTCLMGSMPDIQFSTVTRPIRIAESAETVITLAQHHQNR
jgi:hypothetical protein